MGVCEHSQDGKNGIPRPTSNAWETQFAYYFAESVFLGDLNNTG